MFRALLFVVVAVAAVFNGEAASPIDLQAVLKQHEAAVAVNAVNPKIDDSDAKLTVPEIVTKYGYPCEVHSVTTGDGYILEVHRIPYGKKSGPAENKPVVWLQHGLLGDSSNWIMNTEEKALAYMLANAGYDVWMGNARGNTYSKNHVKYSKWSPKFWNFSWHQMGVYDVPAVIDYALSVTGQEQLQWVGHSMGTTMFWIAMAENPEYNAKVKLMTALAPVAYMEHMKSPLKVLAPIANQIEDIMQLLGGYQFLPNTFLMDLLGATICRDESMLQLICSNVLFLVGGYNTEQLNTTMLPVILGHMPAGASTRSVIHYAQGFNHGKFRQFNYGLIKNLAVYGQSTPPAYDIQKITCPVAFFYGDNDWLADTADVFRLAGELPNLVHKHRVEHDKYTHLDFLWAIDNGVLLNNHVVELINIYNSA